MNLNNKRILCTGGAGFIGSHIVDKLLQLDYEVLIFDNFTTGKIENVYSNLENSDNDKLKVYKGDIRDKELLEKLIRICHIDYIIHQGALANVPDSMENPLEYHDVNVTGTLNVLECARKYNVKRVVLASSSAIENMNSPYAYTKYLNEKHADMYYKLYGLEVICLRYFNVYGERQAVNGYCWL